MGLATGTEILPASSATNTTVTFAENASINDQLGEPQSASVPTPLTLFSALSPSFAKSGYTFSDWNTAADGTGTTYTDGEVYSFAADIVLYAQWTENHVTFLENASASDTVSATELGSTTSNLTSFASLSPAFVNPGYTFSGWNTHSDG
ncbi:MAG TPA: InlB B-repeat-containing protein, partial [Acidimicrobiales bacterium]|nr:InlB B-repeat-containing protein [Acidimicrobiales bacterium]